VICKQTGFAHFIFSVSTQHLPHPTAKEKAGDCSPAFLI